MNFIDAMKSAGPDEKVAMLALNPLHPATPRLTEQACKLTNAFDAGSRTEQIERVIEAMGLSLSAAAHLAALTSFDRDVFLRLAGVWFDLIGKAMEANGTAGKMSVQVLGADTRGGH